MKKYPRFADPTVDFVFKKIFGSEQYKAATIGLINSFITSRQVKDVSFINVEIPGLCEEDRKSCVDVLCTDAADNSTFILEMQVVEQRHFRERTVLYASSVIVHNADKGEEWGYELKPTYVISILGFDLPQTDGDGTERQYVSHYRSVEETSGQTLPGAPEFFFIEPKRFAKNEAELCNYQEKWLYLFRNAKSLKMIPEGFDDNEGFKAYFRASETANFTKVERMEYDKAMITKTDIKYGMKYQYETGWKEGMEKGMEKGMKKGKEEGLQEGMEKGREEGLQEGMEKVAKEMLAKGLAAELISQCTGLSVEQIKNLA